jgi:hypothetical protein
MESASMFKKRKQRHKFLIYLPLLEIRFARILQLLKPSDLTSQAVLKVVLADAAPHQPSYVVPSHPQRT